MPIRDIKEFAGASLSRNTRFYREFNFPRRLNIAQSESDCEMKFSSAFFAASRKSTEIHENLFLAHSAKQRSMLGRTKASAKAKQTHRDCWEETSPVREGLIHKKKIKISWRENRKVLASPQHSIRYS